MSVPIAEVSFRFSCILGNIAACIRIDGTCMHLEELYGYMQLETAIASIRAGTRRGIYISLSLLPRVSTVRTGPSSDLTIVSCILVCSHNQLAFFA